MKELLTNWRFIMGVAFIFIGICYEVKALMSRKRSIRIQGEIIDFIREGNNYFPLIRFTYEGEVLSLQGSNGDNKPRGKVGDQVTVLYDLKNTKYVNIVGNNMDIWVMGFCVVFGVINIIGALEKLNII